MYYDDSYNYHDYESDMVDVFGITQYVLMLVCFLGILGNGGTLWVMSVPPFTNMPHCVLCRALAVVDLLKLTQHLTVAVLYSGWGLVLPIASRAACKVYAFLILTLTHLDAWCITSLAVERLLAVYVPLKMKSLISKRRVRILVSSLVVFFLLWNAELLYRYDLVWLEDLEFWNCLPVTDFGLRGFSGVKKAISEMFATLIPICIMVPCNIAILLRLYQQHRKRQQLGANNANEEELMRITIMICSITFAFIALMTPYSIYISMWGSGNESVQNAWFSVFYGLDTLNTSLNFYAYIMTGKQFREKAFQLLGCRRSDSAGPLAVNVGMRLGDVRKPDEQRPKRHPDSGPKGYPDSGLKGYPDSGPKGYPDSGPKGYPDSGLKGYPDSGPKGYPDSGLKGYPDSGPKGYPYSGLKGYPDSGLKGPKGHPDSGPNEQPDSELLAGNVRMKRQGNVRKPDEQLQRPKGHSGSQDDCRSGHLGQSAETTQSAVQRPVAPHD